MAHEHKRTNKRISPLLWVILIILLLGASVGGVSAYLSASTGALENSFTVDEHPTVKVNADNSITVTNSGYAVYLRAAIVVNWVNEANGNILAEIPEKGDSGDYSLTLGDNWVKHTDGFYYYRSKIMANTTDTTTTPVVTTLSDNTDSPNPEGYTLSMRIAAQTVQAVGTTDSTNADAVEDAWGITAAEITGTTQ